jgi:hypothetical protein
MVTTPRIAKNMYNECHHAISPDLVSEETREGLGTDEESNSVSASAQGI